MAAEAPEPADLARRLAIDLAAAAGQRDAAYATLNQMGGDQVKLVMIGLDALCDMAENPRSPGQLTARKMLDTWARTLARVDQVRAGIVVPTPGNGPAPPTP